MNAPDAFAAGFEILLHCSLTELILLGGAPRTVAIANGTLAAAVGLGLQLWMPGVVLWMVRHSLAVWGARVDPQFIQIFARHINGERCQVGVQSRFRCRRWWCKRRNGRAWQCRQNRRTGGRAKSRWCVTWEWFSGIRWKRRCQFPTTGLGQTPAKPSATQQRRHDCRPRGSRGGDSGQDPSLNDSDT